MSIEIDTMLIFLRNGELGAIEAPAIFDRAPTKADRNFYVSWLEEQQVPFDRNEPNTYDNAAKWYVAPMLHTNQADDVCHGLRIIATLTNLCTSNLIVTINEDDGYFNIDSHVTDEQYAAVTTAVRSHFEALKKTRQRDRLRLAQSAMRSIDFILTDSDKSPGINPSAIAATTH